KYPEADLPHLSVSFLMNPGGDKFAHFMHKLALFVLYKVNSQDDSKILLPPKLLKNDEFANIKQTLLQELVEFETRKSLALQLKLDTLDSQKFEWECNLELNELDEKIKQQENKVKELIEAAPVPPLRKEKLLDLNNNNDAKTEWMQELEFEGRAVEALVHSVSKYRSSLEELNKSLSIAEIHKISDHCIDVDSIIQNGNDLDERTMELFQNVQKSDGSLTDFILRLYENQSELLSKLNSPVDIKKLNELAAELHAVDKDLNDCIQEYGTMENNIQEKLKKVRKNLDELLN
ncbi:hypothetical protein L9F63_020474, partial [Diploptera punctata]